MPVRSPNFYKGIGVVLFFSLLLGVFLVLLKNFFLPGQTSFGVTYSSLYARELGLNEREAFVAVLDDLGVRRIRVPIYWSEVEAENGKWDWSHVDFFMDEAAKRQAEITLVVGHKVPRWPECHDPVWAKELSSGIAREHALQRYIFAAVERYKGHPALFRWQVDNEPFYPFGECELIDPGLLQAEIDLVKKLDPHHPLQLTVSGEQEAWVDLAGPADVLGVSLYRFAWNETLGVIPFPHTPEWYAFHRLFVSAWSDEVIVSELQAEPWFHNERPTDREEAYTAFSAERLVDHAEFVNRARFSEALFWGVEWWYYLHKQGESRLWDTSRQYFLTK